MRGKVCDMSILDAFVTLGVHIRRNQIVAKDVITAWSARLTKEGVLQIAKNVPVTAKLHDKDYRLFTTDKDGLHKAVAQFVLCPIVNAVDKKAKTDVAWSAKTLFTGLAQSVYVTSTLKQVDESAKAVSELAVAWVNTTPKSETATWAKVIRENGAWRFATVGENSIAKSPLAKKASAKAAAKIA